MKEMQSILLLACVNLEVVLSRAETLEARVKSADAKFLKTVREGAKSKRDLVVFTTFLELSLDAKRHRKAHFRWDRENKNARCRNLFADQQEAHNAIKILMREKKRFCLTCALCWLPQLRGWKRYDLERRRARNSYWLLEQMRCCWYCRGRKLETNWTQGLRS